MTCPILYCCAVVTTVLLLTQGTVGAQHLENRATGRVNNTGTIRFKSDDVREMGRQAGGVRNVLMAAGSDPSHPGRRRRREHLARPRAQLDAAQRPLLHRAYPVGPRLYQSGAVGQELGDRQVESPRHPRGVDRHDDRLVDELPGVGDDAVLGVQEPE